MESEWKLPVIRTPIYYHDIIELKEIINSLSEEQLKNFRCPCNECLVVAACNEYCIEIFKYMNYIANHLPTMTANEVRVFRYTVPYEIQSYIEKMLKNNTRLAHPLL